jgi:DNA polymerase-4
MDCDAFYASVEKRDRPEHRDAPLIVGGGVRGVVTTCCYIARTYGVRSAMPMFKALRACPEAVVIKPDFAKYRAESRRIMHMLDAITPMVQPLSLDEAWIDLSGTQRLNGGTPAWQLARLQSRIEAETGLTVSIGLAPNKVLAKIASDLDKPKGFAVIGAAEAKSFLAPRPVTLLPGIGPAFAKTLERDGIRRIGDLSGVGAKILAQRYGAYGFRLAELAEGRDPRLVDPNEVRKGISAETTFDTDIDRQELLEDRLWRMCEKVALQARAKGVAGRVATLKLKTGDFKLVSRRRTLPHPTQTARILFQVTRELLAQELDGRAFRLIGAGIADLAETDVAPSDLFVSDESKARVKEGAMDRIRARFGADAVISGRTLKSDR